MIYFTKMSTTHKQVMIVGDYNQKHVPLQNHRNYYESFHNKVQEIGRFKITNIDINC